MTVLPAFTTAQVFTSAAANNMANSGLTYITSGALSSTATNFVGCFTSEYTDYRILIDTVTVSTGADIYWQMLDGTTPITSANYSWAMYGITENNTGLNTAFAGSTSGFTGITSNLASTILCSSSIDIYGPQLAQRTLMTVASVGYSSAFFSRQGFSHHNLATAYSGIRFLTASAATFTGNVTIYGYRKP